MKEIKFRAWDTLDKKMRPDIFALGRINHIEIGSNDYPYSYASYEYNPYDFFKSSRYIPLQYTGLKDKNGVEIYEGDIVKFQYEDFYNNEEDCFDESVDNEFGIGQVSWGGSYPAFDITTLKNKNVSAHECEYNIFSCECYVIKVIGNIYENPELLGNLI